MEVQVEHREPAWVHAGSILRAHGVHGALRVRFEISPNALSEPLEVVRVVPRKGAPRVMHLKGVRDVHEAALVELAEVESREAAQLLAGAAIQFPEDVLPPPAEGDAYVYELVGAQVQDVEGNALGVVARVADNGGQALLVIKDEQAGERLLPLVPQTFHAFARETSILTVLVPAGLWE